MAARDSYDVRLKSSRAPYRRAGVRFTSNREPVIVPASQLTEQQLALIEEDGAISVEIVRRSTGQVIDRAELPGDPTPEEVAAAQKAAEEARLKAEAEAKAKADAKAEAARAKAQAKAKTAGKATA